MVESRQLRRSNGRLTSLTRPVQACQFLLERLIQEFMPAMAQKHKQLGSPYSLHDLFLLLREIH
jgi:hypothetical protein